MASAGAPRPSAIAASASARTPAWSRWTQGNPAWLATPTRAPRLRARRCRARSRRGTAGSCRGSRRRWRSWRRFRARDPKPRRGSPSSASRQCQVCPVAGRRAAQAARSRHVDGVGVQRRGFPQPAAERGDLRLRRDQVELARTRLRPFELRRRGAVVGHRHRADRAAAASAPWRRRA